MFEQTLLLNEAPWLNWLELSASGPFSAEPPCRVVTPRKERLGNRDTEGGRFFFG
jgi:hypothetical protein